MCVAMVVLAVWIGWISSIVGGVGLAWSETRKIRRLGEIGIERLLRNFVFLGVSNQSKSEGAQQWVYHGTKRSENSSRLCT